MSDLLYEKDGIVSQVVDDHLVITIPKIYLKRSIEYGITSGNPAIVKDEKEMIEWYEHAMMDIDDGSHFNRCIDSIAIDALEQGEKWLDAE